jgi:hypothetical protein
MATVFDAIGFKKKTLDMFTGLTSVSTLAYIVPYNGTQPADPSTAPAGTAAYPSYSYGNYILTKMSAAGGGVSQLSSPAAPQSPANAVTAASLTFARIYTSGGVPVIDTPVSLAGGGGGVILDSLTSNVGAGMNVIAFSLKMPSSLGTLLLSASLADRLVDMWVVNSTVAPNLGTITGGGSAIMLYSGAAPATADAPATGTLLATFNMTGTNLWAAAVGGAAALAAAGPTVTAAGTGTAGYFRMQKTNGAFTFTMQGSVGTISGASDMILSTLALTSGTTSVQITDFTISI